MKIYALNFRPGVFVESSRILSPRKTFQVGKRLKRWWRHEELYLRGVVGLFAGPVIPAAAAELCPWVQPEIIGFRHLPREGVDIYYLGSAGKLSEGALVFFSVLFDWHNGTDVLVKQTWPPDGTVLLYTVAEPEWRSAVLNVFYSSTIT